VPGESTQKAVTAFLEHFRNALCVLDGKGDVVVPRSGSLLPYNTYSWVLSANKGMKLGQAGTLYASMQFWITHANPNFYPKRFKVEIAAYNYKLEQSGGSDRWRMHWHPDGVSESRGPHLHIPPNLKVHRPCNLITFETAIRWCIADGAPLTCSRTEAEDELSRLERSSVIDHSVDIPRQKRVD
jgi:hypothetical protein